MLPGEGVGVVVLKRLADAERDGDRIYAVVKGVGLASDGRGAGLAAPSARGHARAIRRAYRRAGIDPATVGLVEGHGLGVPGVRPRRAPGLARRLPQARSGPAGRAGGGLVDDRPRDARGGDGRPDQGGAGAASPRPAADARTPTSPHPLLAGADSPFTLNPRPGPGFTATRPHPRRAGVNAFGFAGINAHAVLEEHAASADGGTPGLPCSDWETEAILLGAPDRAGLARPARGAARLARREPNGESAQGPGLHAQHGAARVPVPASAWW